MTDNTVDAVVDETRVILQDKVDPKRYSDDELIQNLNDGLGQLRRVRPDAFLKNLLSTIPTVSAGEALPTDEIFRSGLIYYSAGRAELRDDSFAVEGRANTLLGRAITEWRTAA